MKFIVILLLLTVGQVWATSEALCELDHKDPASSTNPIYDLRFETLVDIFTVTNAKTLAMNFEGNNLIFMRSTIDVVGDQTRMTYLLRRNNRAVRVAMVTLDRSPKRAKKTGVFYGAMTISREVGEGEDMMALYQAQQSALTYGFSCRF
jgi:hypothetical protein